MASVEREMDRDNIIDLMIKVVDIYEIAIRGSLIRLVMNLLLRLTQMQLWLVRESISDAIATTMKSAGQK